MSLRCEFTIQPDAATYAMAQRVLGSSTLSPSKQAHGAKEEASKAVRIKETIDIRTQMEIIHLPFRCDLLPPADPPGVLHVDRRPSPRTSQAASLEQIS